VDGVILTKLDGDARGGAALSMKESMGKPILFTGVGRRSPSWSLPAERMARASSAWATSSPWSSAPIPHGPEDAEVTAKKMLAGRSP